MLQEETRNKLRANRKMQGYSIYTFAEVCDLSSETVSRIERGVGSSLESLEKYLKGLGKSLDEILQRAL